MPFFLLLLCLIALPCQADTPEKKAPPTIGNPTQNPRKSITQVRYWAGGAGRNEYDTAVVKLALEATRQQWGNYQLTIVDESFGTHRGRRMLAQGDIINLYAAPARPESVTQKEKLVAIPVPILKGLLGYRRLVVHRDLLPTFAKLSSREQLMALVAGQGKDWLDVDIYRHNGFAVEDNTVYSNLFTMLKRHRFDYLPLGAHEVETALEVYSHSDPELALVPGLVLYYPFPVVVQVSARQPQLVARMQEGMAIIAGNGQLDALFEEFFAGVLNRLRQPETRVIPLQNPFMPLYPQLKTPALLEAAREL